MLFGIIFIILTCKLQLTYSSYSLYFSDLIPNESQVTPYTQHGNNLPATNLKNTDQSSECALILQRNILPISSAQQYNGFFNLFNSHKYAKKNSLN